MLPPPSHHSSLHSFSLSHKTLLFLASNFIKTYDNYHHYNTSLCNSGRKPSSLASSSNKGVQGVWLLFFHWILMMVCDTCPQIRGRLTLLISSRRCFAFSCCFPRKRTLETPVPDFLNVYSWAQYDMLNGKTLGKLSSIHMYSAIKKMNGSLRACEREQETSRVCVLYLYVWHFVHL